MTPTRRLTLLLLALATALLVAPAAAPTATAAAAPKRCAAAKVRLTDNGSVRCVPRAALRRLLPTASGAALEVRTRAYPAALVRRLSGRPGPAVPAAARRAATHTLAELAARLAEPPAAPARRLAAAQPNEDDHEPEIVRPRFDEATQHANGGEARTTKHVPQGRVTTTMIDESVVDRCPDAAGLVRGRQRYGLGQHSVLRLPAGGTYDEDFTTSIAATVVAHVGDDARIVGFDLTAEYELARSLEVRGGPNAQHVPTVRVRGRVAMTDVPLSAAHGDQAWLSAPLRELALFGPKGRVAFGDGDPAWTTFLQMLALLKQDIDRSLRSAEDGWYSGNCLTVEWSPGGSDLPTAISMAPGATQDVGVAVRHRDGELQAMQLTVRADDGARAASDAVDTTGTIRVTAQARDEKGSIDVEGTSRRGRALGILNLVTDVASGPPYRFRVRYARVQESWTMQEGGAPRSCARAPRPWVSGSAAFDADGALASVSVLDARYGQVEGELEARIPGAWSARQVHGCRYGPNGIETCDRDLPDQPIMGEGVYPFSAHVELPADGGALATITWSPMDPEIGTVDGGDEVCNVHVWDDMDPPVTTFPVARMLSGEPFTISADGTWSSGEDNYGHPVSTGVTYHLVMQLQLIR